MPGSQAAGRVMLLSQVDPGTPADGEVRAKDIPVQRGAGSGCQVIDLCRGAVFNTGILVRIIRIIGQVLVDLAQVLFRYVARGVVSVAVVDWLRSPFSAINLPSSSSAWLAAVSSPPASASFKSSTAAS